jgi:hypothetical protein
MCILSQFEALAFLRSHPCKHSISRLFPLTEGIGVLKGVLWAREEGATRLRRIPFPEAICHKDSSAVANCNSSPDPLAWG